MMIVKVPTSAGGMGKTGSEKAPDAIEECIGEIFSSETTGKEPECSFVEIKSSGQDLKSINEKIFSKADELFSKGEKPIFLGGDHSITYPIVKAFAKRNKNIGLVIFDSHPDCTSDTMPPTHEDYIQAIVNEGIVSPENITILCVRNPAPEETAYMRGKGIQFIPMAEMFGKAPAVCEEIMKKAKGFGALYLSIDIDAVDPAFAPGTGYIEPGGLSSREMLYFIQQLKNLKNLRAADIVEVDPQKDIINMTSKLAAKIIVELGFYSSR